MKKNKKNKLTSIVILSLIAACMITIFIFSSQNNTNTNNLSGKVTEKIAKLIFFDYDKMSAQTQNEIIVGLNKFVRKLAHLTVYFMLGFFLFVGTLFLKLKNKYRFLTALGLSIAYAISDELHQLLVSGRTAQLLDVAIDSCGAFLGGICCFAFFVVVEKTLHKNIV